MVECVEIVAEFISVYIGHQNNFPAIGFANIEIYIIMMYYDSIQL